MKTTLFAVKIKTGRTARELAILGVGFVAFGLVVAGLFVAQYKLCQRDHPGRSFSACVHRTDDE